MNTILKNKIKKSNFTAKEISEAEKIMKKKGGKQIMGCSISQIAGEAVVKRYVLEDGSEIIEGSNGKSTQWPKNKKTKAPEMPQEVIK